MSIKKLWLSVVLVFTGAGLLYAQEYKVHGKIFDSKSNKPLEFVTVKVADTTYGTTGSNNGEYVLRLKNGEYKIIFSYIGYFTDTSDVFVESGDVEKNIYLRPSEIMTDVIEVLGEDPAYEIIRKAIKYKKQFKEKLNEYNFEAYTKYVIRSNVGTPEDENDTAKTE
jgi:hypothetical protein